ncbi:MAG: MarR family winged helix-turn-helix transcriptional regulator [Janthinobacterium lividum]
MIIQKNDLQLASELRMVITRLIKKLRSKASASDKLSLTERSTIVLLDQHKELLPNELAAMEKVTTQSMSQILSHLVELDYINRRISDTDRRKSIISLSEKGQQMLHQVRNERNEWLNRALSETCSAEEQEILRQALLPLTKLVDFN